MPLPTRNGARRNPVQQEEEDKHIVYIEQSSLPLTICFDQENQDGMSTTLIESEEDLDGSMRYDET
jgi:hypothetical protein